MVIVQQSASDQRTAHLWIENDEFLRLSNLDDEPLITSIPPSTCTMEYLEVLAYLMAKKDGQ